METGVKNSSSIYFERAMVQRRGFGGVDMSMRTIYLFYNININIITYYELYIYILISLNYYLEECLFRFRRFSRRGLRLGFGDEIWPQKCPPV